MIKHILIPLDGSHLGESALLPAARIAGSTHASITLIHVIERNAPAHVHGERHLGSVGEAEQYLSEVARRAVFARNKVDTHVHTAEVHDVARSLADHCVELAPDLIVMTTHGRRDARQIIAGTVAQQIIALGKTPVMVIRPTHGNTTAGAILPAGSSILVPIDNSRSHEAALPLAVDLAHALDSRLQLLTVVPKVADLRRSESAAALISPSAARVRLEIDSEEARRYLKESAEKLSGEGIAVGTDAVRGDPATLIVRAAKRIGAGLVVLGTHGRAGADAFWNESVAARVVRHSAVPLLLVPLVADR